MKLLPGLTTFDYIFDNTFNDSFLKNSNTYMRTNVKEIDDQYVLDMELPGFCKEDITIELHDGYLTITGNKSSSNEEKDNNGNIIRQERYSGTCSRSFYVGEEIKQEDIKANYINGELKIALPKKSQKQVESHKYIPID